MPKRFIDSEIFKDQWFRNLKPNDKLLWIYILCNCDYAGMWKIDKELAEFSIGGKIDFEQINMGKIRMIQVSEETYFIPDFIKFQYKELNPYVKLHEGVIKTLKDKNIWDDENECINLNKNKYSLRVTKELVNSSLTVQDKDKDKAKDKEKEKGKKNFGEFVKLSNEEYEKLCSKYSEEFAKACIERLDNYIGSTGRKYKSHYRTILNWVIERELKTGEWEK